jgi:Ca2+-binding EF-hand superfamily protein
MVLDVTGPSVFKFASHLNAHRQASRENVTASWWQVGKAQMFQKLDIDLSQTISFQEFTTCFRDTDDYVSTARTVARFKNIDSNSDGSVDDIEFMGKRPINETFVSIDTNSSKTITESELLAAVNKTGDFVRDTEIRDLFVSLDIDESGYIDDFEFNAAPSISMVPAQLMYPPSAFQGLDSGFKLQIHPSHYLTAGDDTVIQFKIHNPPLTWTDTAIVSNHDIELLSRLHLQGRKM